MRYAMRFGLLTGVMFCLGATVCHEAAGQWVWTPQIKRFIQIDRLPKETPELQLEHARSVFQEGNYKEALHETEKFIEFYEDSEFADDNQFLRGEIRMAQGKMLDAAKEFQQVVANYPDSDLYDQVIEKQYEIGDHFYDLGIEKQDERWAWFKERPFKQAIEVYTMVIDNQPFTVAAAEAQYKVGLCHFRREEYIEAAFEYRRVVEDYANSEWVDDASYGLARTYYESSLPPDYDQGPSELAIQAINQFVQKFPSDERVDQLVEWRQDMRNKIAQQRLNAAEFYERRRDFEAARISYEVVVDNFPDTEAGNAAQEWLANHPSNNG